MITFKPLSDQILVKVLPFEDHVKSIWIPETVDHGRLPIRQGIVVAIGCGDVFAPKCDACDGSGSVAHDYADMGCPDWYPCDECGGTGYLPHERTPFTVKVGDHVLIHPRPWAEVMIDGDPHLVLHEDQHVLGIIEGAEA